nr:MAG TPA: hypothetical protein [Caudoviricetes sp.]
MKPHHQSCSDGVGAPFDFAGRKACFFCLFFKQTKYTIVQDYSVYSYMLYA